MHTSFVTLIVPITIVVGQNYCPSSSWVECGINGASCNIPASIKAATISHGYPPSSSAATDGKWLFTEITNNAGTTLQFECNDGNFGNPHPGGNKYCCYNIKDNNGPSTNEDNWQFLAAQGSSFSVKQPTYIRYGANGKYSYRWMSGKFSCSDAGNNEDIHWFANVIPGVTKQCHALRNSTIKSGSVVCGDEKSSGQCNLKINGNGNGLQLMQYGVEGNNMVYQYGYAQNGLIPCTDDTFGDPVPSQDKFCYVVNQTNFVGANGYWSVAASCGGVACIINEEIGYGVTSTTSESCTQSWTQSLSETVSASLSFIIGSASKSLTLSQSTTVSETVSAAYSVHTSKSCGARCGNGSADIWTLYQWVMVVGEYVGADIIPFDTNCCYYICSTNVKPPQCPPTYCNNTDCTECRGYP